MPRPSRVPGEPATHVYSVRLTAREHAALLAYCRQNSIGVVSLIFEAVDEYLQADGEPPVFARVVVSSLTFGASH